MKNILFNILCLISAISIISSCKDNTTTLSESYARFSSSNFEAAWSGTVNIYVEWSETEWEIIKADGEVISSISTTKGGNAKEIDQKTKIEITLNENTTTAKREQKLTVRNLQTGETSETVISQGARNATASFENENKTVNYLAGSTTISIKWSEVEWELTIGEGNLIENISPMQGGDVTKSGMSTDITITYTANPSEEDIRSQKIYLTNTTDNSQTEFVLYQEAQYSKVASLTFDTSVKHQYVVGFGGMYNPFIWCGGFLITENEIQKMYGDGEDELGYNILRLMIYPESGNWSKDVEGAKTAQRLGATIFACPWYCPEDLIEKIDIDGKEEKVDHLKPENYGAYADHLVDYINYMKGQGVNLHAISMQNEPDMDFTTWSSTEVTNFMSQQGNKIRETGVKLMAPEACGFQTEYTDAVRNNSEAWANTDIVVGHLYQGFIEDDPYNNDVWAVSNAAKLRNYFKTNSASWGKQWWMTEHLFNEGENSDNASEWVFRNWDYNLTHLGKEIHTCMDHNCSAYVYWYMKRFYGLIGDNDNRSLEDEGEVSKNGYIMSHYAKYAKNTSRIDLNFIASQSGVVATAYINETENEVTLVMQNYSPDPVTVEVSNKTTGKVINGCEAVVTDQNRNMETLNTGFSSPNEKASIPMPAESIVSVRLKYN